MSCRAGPHGFHDTCNQLEPVKSWSTSLSARRCLTSSLNLLGSFVVMSAAQPSRCCELLTPPTRLLTFGFLKPELMIIGPTILRAGSRIITHPYNILYRCNCVGLLPGYFSKLQNSLSVKCSVNSFLNSCSILVLELSCVIIETKDTACKQERLPDVYQKAVSYIVNDDDLISYKCNAGHNEQHCTCIFRDFEGITLHTTSILRCLRRQEWRLQCSQ